jgi:hypothetical protein
MGVRVLRVLGVLVVGSALLAPGVASANWSRPVALASFPAGGPYLEQPVLARDAAGVGVIAWGQGGSDDEQLEACVRPAGTGWSSPVHVGVIDQAADERPRVAIDERGEATLAWVNGKHSGWDVEAASAMAGTPWGSRQLLTPGRLQGQDPQLAHGPGGSLKLVMFGGPGNEAEQIVLWTRSAAGRWSAAQMIADMHGQGPVEPQIAVDAAGATIVAWRTEGARGARIDVVALRPNGRRAGPVEVLTPKARGRREGGPRDLELVADARGDAVLSWDHEGSDASDSSGPGPIEAATRAAGARFGAAGVIDAGAEAGQPAAVIDSAGQATVVFGSNDGGHDVVDAVRHTLRSGWTPPRQISRAGVNSFEPRLANGRGSEALALWTANNQPTSGPESTMIESSLGGPDGGWQAPVVAATVSGGVTRAALAASATGQATAVWIQQAEIEAPEIIETADFMP